MASVTYAQVVADCELLMEALEPLLEEFPHLSTEHTELVAFLDRIKGLKVRQNSLTGELRQVVRLRSEAELEGVDLRSRVAAQLRGKLGFASEDLLQFGVSPRRRVRRRSEEETPPTEEPPGEEPEEPESPPVE